MNRHKIKHWLIFCCSTYITAPLRFPSTKPFVMDIGAETLRLGWRPADVQRRLDMPPVSYRVEAQKLPSEEWIPLASRVHDTSLYLSDMEPDRDYNVRVRAQGPFGVSQPTAPVWLPRAAGKLLSVSRLTFYQSTRLGVYKVCCGTTVVK